MEELKNLIDDNIELIGDITSLLYQKKIEQAYTDMPKLLDSILDISGKGMEGNVISEEEAKEIANILGNAMKAMESKDAVLLADVLQYDMTDCMNSLKDKLI